MKIFCVGRNYVEHAEELNNPVPAAPVIFMKPPTALLRNGMPFYYPVFSKEVHFEGEIVLKIDRNGRKIKPQEASKYFNQVTIGFDMTARDLQRKQKEKGLPWEISKAFDGAAPIGKFVRYKGQKSFSIFRNGEEVQKGNRKEMIFSFEHIISYISHFFMLQKGDLIFTGTPAGVGEINVGDVLSAALEGENLISFSIK